MILVHEPKNLAPEELRQKRHEFLPVHLGQLAHMMMSPPYDTDLGPTFTLLLKNLKVTLEGHSETWRGYSTIWMGIIGNPH
jgi:hypothetical protein